VWNVCAHSCAALESCADGAAEQIAIGREAAREHGDIVEVLHAAVGHSELHHGLELLGDDGLTRRRGAGKSRSGGSSTTNASGVTASPKPTSTWSRT